MFVPGICVCVTTAGYPPFLPQMPPHVGLPPELCPRELLPLSAAAAAALGSISPGASLPYASRPSLVNRINWQIVTEYSHYFNSHFVAAVAADFLD